MLDLLRGPDGAERLEVAVILTRDNVIEWLRWEIDSQEGGADAAALAVEFIDLVHDRGAGDIGDIRAAIKRLAVHFPRTKQ